MTPKTRLIALFAAALAAATNLASCVGTPLPDPPSFSESLVVADDGPMAGETRLVGAAHAVRPGGITLRITVPPAAGVLVSTNANGSLGRVLTAMPTDTFYVEAVESDADRFLGAFRAPMAGSALARVSAGPDGDGDGSPDAIDCAPMDPAHAGRRCPPPASCTTDSDCSAGERCTAGVCTMFCAPVAEICNGADDDCNGLVDDGDPGSGALCTPTMPRLCTWGIAGCAGSPTCIEGTPVTEICGNGVDDDCNGVIDDGC
jgi:hypothetical protein